MKTRAKIGRPEWVSLLESLSNRELGHEDARWVWLLQQLRLTPDDYEEVSKAIGEGRWRNAENPKAYLWRVARRIIYKKQQVEAKSNPLISVSGSPEFSAEQSLEWLSHLQLTGETLRGADGTWRAGAGYERDYDDYDDDGYPMTVRGRLRKKIPDELRLYPPIELRADEVNIDPRYVPVVVDFEAWARRAGFDDWEMRVLEFQRKEISRDKALAAQPDEASRKALQAAWRRFDRTGKQRLRDAAKKSL